MKKFLFLSAIAVIFAACQSKTEYTVAGKVADSTFEGQQVILSEVTENEMVAVDSTTITNGKYTFKGQTETPVLRFIRLGNDQNSPSSIVMIEPGKINIVYDSAFHLSGTPINNAYSEFEIKQKELTAEIQTLSEKYNEAATDGSMTEELETELTAGYEKIADKAKTLNYNFIKENIDNELGQFMFMTSANAFETDQQKEILAMASEEYKENKNIKSILDRLETLEAVAIGKDFIDFSMETPEGESVLLSDYVGKDKYVFIDFWAAWCGPCINEMPNVVEAYKKYKDKGLEIVGVSLDQDKDKWIQGIEELKMTWPQMSDLKLWESKVVKLYAISSIPHTILLDKEGKIIAKDLRGEELHEKLAEFLD